MKRIFAALAIALPALGSAHAQQVQYYPVPAGAGPNAVAPATDGTVWFTAQLGGYVGRLDPTTGSVKQIALGDGSVPQDITVGPDGAAWVADGGRNALIRVDAKTEAIKVRPLPGEPLKDSIDLKAVAFDKAGRLWFTGQSGFYGRANASTGEMMAYPAPGGAGPNGIAVTPDGATYYASLAGNIARPSPATGRATAFEPPTKDQGARGVWSDSQGRIWVSESSAGQLGRFDPSSNAWSEWKLPAPGAQPFAVYVDERDIVWVTDVTSNAILSFDQKTEKFTTFALTPAGASVQKLSGRPGEVWGAASGSDKLVVIRTGAAP